jgi:hypothetical protein|tara:strand:- start:277 stop:1092 length:816 start_codon:yes stop_codon:yes gene_type:complete
MKTCRTCKIEKLFTEFYKDKRAKDGYKGECKECCKRYPSRNRKLLLSPDEYREYLNKVNLKRKERLKNNPELQERTRGWARAWRDKNREYYNTQRREYFKNNPEAHKKKIESCRRFSRRPEIIKARKAKYHEMKKNNPEEYKKYIDRHTIWCRNRRNNNMEYRLMDSLRGRLNSALRKHNVVKLETTIKLVGCPMPELIKYLENKFKPGMSWKNREKWHIDHVIPCISFDLSKLEEQRKCFHYTNLQPLWAHENYSKGTKIISGDIISQKM